MLDRQLKIYGICFVQKRYPVDTILSLEKLLAFKKLFGMKKNMMQMNMVQKW